MNIQLLVLFLYFMTIYSANVPTKAPRYKPTIKPPSKKPTKAPHFKPSKQQTTQPSESIVNPFIDTSSLEPVNEPTGVPFQQILSNCDAYNHQIDELVWGLNTLIPFDTMDELTNGIEYIARNLNNLKRTQNC